MYNQENNRLDRIEAIVESNSKAIQALSSDIAEMKRDRNYMYQLMADLTNKMSVLTSSQAQIYDTISNLDNRQSQLTNQQQQLIDIIKTLRLILKKRHEIMTNYTYQDVEQRLEELRISTNFDAYSGLMAEKENNREIRIFDVHAEIIIEPNVAIEVLEKFEPVDWNEFNKSSECNVENIFDPFWQTLGHAAEKNASS